MLLLPPVKRLSTVFPALPCCSCHADWNYICLFVLCGVMILPASGYSGSYWHTYSEVARAVELNCELGGVLLSLPKLLKSLDSWVWTVWAWFLPSPSGDIPYPLAERLCHIFCAVPCVWSRFQVWRVLPIPSLLLTPKESKKFPTWCVCAMLGLFCVSSLLWRSWKKLIFGLSRLRLTAFVLLGHDGV